MSATLLNPMPIVPDVAVATKPPELIRAAGIMITSKDKRILMLRRGDGSDYPGMWCFPGGRQEDNETIEECARRETLEETGQNIKSQLGYLAHARTIAGDGTGNTVDFTTFAAFVNDEFTPDLSSGEHTGFMWVNESEALSLPDIHPGVAIALRVRFGTETDIARMMVDGLLSSPQRFSNFWLFAIRITGTGTAFRNTINEFVYRPPEYYLNEEFLARCNGLDVIVDHPQETKRNPSGMLDTSEYKKRIIGSIVLPYIRGDEVWGIARIRDARAAQFMMKTDLSTSPGVVARPADGDSMAFALEDGKTMLFEGKPYLIDHVAITFAGVWDKDGASGPGVLVETISRSDSQMAETEEEKREREDKARRDAEAAKAADPVMQVLNEMRKDFNSRMDSIDKRFDAQQAKMQDYENKWDAAVRRDSETEEEKREREDKARRDAAAEETKRQDAARRDNETEEEKEKREREDKARKDAAEIEEKEKREREDKARKDEDERRREDARRDSSTIATLQARVDAMEKDRPMPTGHADYNTMVGFQARADRAYSMFGMDAPRPMQGETPMSYRRRLAKGVQQHSTDYKDVDLSSITDDKVLSIAENRIYNDAVHAARHPVDVGAGELRKITRKDELGRNVTEYFGDPNAWMETWKLPYRIAAIRRNPNAPYQGTEAG